MAWSSGGSRGAFLALLVSVAGLELSVCLAGERDRASAHTRAGLHSTAIDDELLPVGEEVDDARCVADDLAHALIRPHPLPALAR